MSQRTARPMTRFNRAFWAAPMAGVGCGHLLQRQRGPGKAPQRVQRRGRGRLSVALALSLGVLLAALAAPDGAATGDPVGASQAGEQSILIWAYFDGDTPVSGGRVHVYANGHELQGDGIAGSDVRTFSDGTALMRLDRLPSKLRVVISGGRAGGRPGRGSLKTSVDGADVGDVIEGNPVTTVAEIYAHREDGSDHHARDVTERTLGIPLVLNDADLYATDRWFGGDRFQRWTLEHGSVEEGARSLVRLAEEPGVDRHLFRPPDRGGAEARAAADPVGKGVDTILDGIIDHIATAASGSGLHGIVFGLALKGIKAAITDGLSGQEQSEVNGVEAQLTEISTRLAALENQLKNVVFQLKAD